MILRGCDEKTLGVLQGVSFLILILFLVQKSWWITSDNLLYISLAETIVYNGAVFLFIPVLIIGSRFIKKYKTNSDKKFLFSGSILLSSGITLSISAILYLIYQVKILPGLYSMLDQINLMIARASFDLLAYVLIVIAIILISRNSDKNIVIRAIKPTQYLFLFWIAIVAARYIFTMVYGYDTLIIGATKYLNTQYALLNVEKLIISISLTIFVFSLCKNQGKNYLTKIGKVTVLGFLLTSIVTMVFWYIEAYVISEDIQMFAINSIVSPIDPVSNLRKILEAINSVSLYLTILVIGIIMFISSRHKNEHTDQANLYLTPRMVSVSAFVLLLFYLTENYYLYSKINFFSLGVFFTTHYNQYSDFIPWNLLMSAITVSYMLIAVIFILLVLSINSRKKIYFNEKAQLRGVHFMIFLILSFVLLHVFTNFGYRMYAFAQSPISSIPQIFGILITKSIEVVILLFIGILILLPKFQNIIKSKNILSNRFFKLIGVSLILQSISSIGNVLQNYADYYIESPSKSTQMLYQIDTSISIILSEIASILLILAIVFQTIKQIDYNENLRKISKITAYLVITIVSIFKILLTTGGFTANSEMFDIFFGDQMILSAVTFDGFITLLFFYLLAILGYSMMRKLKHQKLEI